MAEMRVQSMIGNGHIYFSGAYRINREQYQQLLRIYAQGHQKGQPHEHLVANQRHYLAQVTKRAPKEFKKMEVIYTPGPPYRGILVLTRKDADQYHALRRQRFPTQESLLQAYNQFVETIWAKATGVHRHRLGPARRALGFITSRFQRLWRLVMRPFRRP